MLVPYFNLPEAALVGVEFVALIGGTDGFLIGDFARVPDIALILLQEELTAGHEQTISGLALCALLGLDNPA